MKTRKSDRKLKHENRKRKLKQEDQKGIENKKNRKEYETRTRKSLNKIIKLYKRHNKSLTQDSILFKQDE